MKEWDEKRDCIGSGMEWKWQCEIWKMSLVCAFADIGHNIEI